MMDECRVRCKQKERLYKLWHKQFGGGGSPALNPKKAPTAMLSITNMMTAGRELRQELPDLPSTSTHSEAACVSLLR